MTQAELRIALHEYGHCDDWMTDRIEPLLCPAERSMIADSLIQNDPRYGIELAIRHLFSRLKSYERHLAK